jgi:hypothetical protein
MKKMTLLRAVWGLVLLTFATSCEEVPVIVTPVQQLGDCPAGDISLVADQQKQVLIEEFTGVRCVNCPDGSEAVKALINQYGEQVVVLSFHAGFFSDPYPESVYDFRTPAGNALLNFHGSPLGYPAAIIDRSPFGGSSRLHLGQNDWAGAIAAQVADAPAVKIYLENIYDPVSRNLEVQVSLFFEEDVEGEIRISVMITEDRLQDYQETPSGLQADYEHNHVLRTALSSPTGNILSEPGTAGTRFCKSFTGIIDESWKSEDCTVIVFVHKGSSEEKEVLQAQQAALVP